MNFLFDLDGTLVDSAEGIRLSVIKTFESLGLAPPRASDIPIGPPILTTIHKYVGDEKFEKARIIYQEIYDNEGVLIADFYRGIPELLSSLHKRDGTKLFIVTSKAEKFALKMIHNLGWSNYFSGIYGSSLTGEFREKKDLLNRLFKETSISRESSIMIGDRHHDLDAAHALGISSIGVLWGYGSLAELEACQPRLLVRSPQELAQSL